MGLDGVELLMSWEESCGVAISDADAELIVTPEDAFILLRRLVSESGDETCRSQRAFYEIRGILRKRGHPRSAIRPDTRWDSLESPRPLISEVLRSFGLYRYLPVSRIKLTLVTLASVALIYFGKSLPIGGQLAFISGWILLAFSVLVCFSTENVVRKIQTIGELVTFITERQPIRYGKDFSDDELRNVIRFTTFDQLGIRPDQFGWDKRFVQDLGMD